MELFYISQLLILLKNKIGFFKCLTESKFIGRILLFSFLCIAEVNPGPWALERNDITEPYLQLS